MHLRSIDFQLWEKDGDTFPFNLPLIRQWQELELSAPVTIFVGENGTGKSTVMEAVAAAAKMVTVGSQDIHRDPSLAGVRELGKRARLVWNKRTKKGFFLRAEDYFGYVKRQAQMRAEMEADLLQIDQEFEGRSDYAKGLAKSPLAGQLHSMEQRYGGDLDHRSHGESFLSFFQARFVPGGLYLLDEPEAPLSPLRQLALLSMLKEMVEQQAQFIIITHAPIVMAFPGAEVLSFDEVPVRPVDYHDLEHVRLTRDFLNDPEQFLRHL